MSAPPIKLLLIDDDVDFAHYVEACLTGTKTHAIEVDYVTDYDRACELVAAGVHDAYLVDHELGIEHKNGFDLIRYGCDVTGKPMIMLTSNLHEDTPDTAISLGATDFLHKQHATIPVIERAVRNSIARCAQLHDKSTAPESRLPQHRDQLTGVYSRIAIEQHLEQCLLACGDGQVGVLLYIDLDNLQTINDYYGHVAGDQVLKIIARRIEELALPGFRLGRMGGDEFLLSGPATACDIFADGTVHRWLGDIHSAAARPLQIFDVAGETAKVSINASVGAVRFGTRTRNRDYLIALANKAMREDRLRSHGATDNP